ESAPVGSVRFETLRPVLVASTVACARYGLPPTPTERDPAAVRSNTGGDPSIRETPNDPVTWLTTSARPPKPGTSGIESGGVSASLTDPVKWPAPSSARVTFPA